MKPAIKNIIIIVVIIVLAFAGYNFFLKKEAAPALVSTTGALTGEVTAENQLGQEFLTTLLGLRTIRLDDAIFTSPSFNALLDFTTVLVPEGDEGRPNPFAPIGSEFPTESEVPPSSETSQ
jgi:hypothetical protein